MLIVTILTIDIMREDILLWYKENGIPLWCLQYFPVIV